MKEQLSFIGLTSSAIKIVTEEYPDASLRGAIGSVSDGGATTNPKDVTQWDFNFGDGTTAACINLKTAGQWGEFGTPAYTPEPTGGNVVPWPIGMDINEAAELLQNAGHTQPFDGITLRWPMQSPPYTQPLYIFSFKSSTPVAVGVYDKNVFTL